MLTKWYIMFLPRFKKYPMRQLFVEIKFDWCTCKHEIPITTNIIQQAYLSTGFMAFWNSMFILGSNKQGCHKTQATR